jgi:hypothetical protein
MLDTIAVAPFSVPAGVRSLTDRDEYGPLGGRASGLFTDPVVPRALLAERDDQGRRLGAWVPDSFLL